jgi:diadenylate cyclase
MAQFLRFLPLLPTLTPTGVVDILVVAFLVYQALMVVRGTRAGHILLGIFMLVGLYGISVWAGLEALRAVLSFLVPLIGAPPHPGAAGAKALAGIRRRVPRS